MELKGQLEDIIYQNESNSYTIAVMQTEDLEVVTIVGYLPFIAVGDTLKVTGKMVVHQEYGEQFKVETFEKLMPESAAALEKYLASGTIKGIGPATAKKIIDKFGEDTLNVFKFEPMRLAEVKGISKDKAYDIAEEFNEKWEVWQIVSFLEQFGIGANNSKKVYDALGTNAIEKIEENPYVLVDIVYGINFNNIDKIAMQIGIPMDSDYRIKSGIKYALLLASYNGNTCVEKENLITYVQNVLEVSREQIEDNIIDTVSLPKKKFREEDEEENEYTKKNYNRTQQVFRKSNKKIKPNNNINENDFNINNNNNNSSRIKTNYYNNINNNINNFFNIGETTNYGERKTIEYINNANLLRNKYNKKIKNFTSNNQFINEENDYDNDNDIFRVGNNSQINYMQQKNSMIDNNNLNIKNLDKSYDMFRAKNTPLPKRVINKNILSNNINNPKKINTHSPRELTKYRPYEKNTVNNFQRNGRIYNKINYKRNTPAYVKKSPGKINIKKTREYRSLGKLDTDNKNQNRSKQNKSNNYNITNKKNIIGNNDGMEISAIYGLNSSIDSSTSNRTNNKNIKSIETKKENTMVFNIEDLLVLEEKLNNITFSLESNKNIDSQCFNFWNYYFNCSLYKILEKIFPNEEDANIIRLSINYQLMSIMVCYDFAFCNNIEDEDLNLSLIELIYFNHNNLMIICEYILTKITPENTDNIWVLKLQEIVKNSKFSQSKEPYNNINNTSVPIQKILNNTNKIIKKIKSILLNYQSDSTSLLKNYILNLPRKTYSEINNFFRSQILRIDNYEGSLVPPSFFKKNQDFAPLPAPYLQFPSSKPYTLILDLDETLVSFQIKSKKEGTLRARPFLFAFLEEMGHYYELIVWTSATEAYANSLIDAIEYDKQYFDYILFREHAIIIGDEFVKDLNRVGRGLDRIIIVDDMPQNFRLQKQNGITIKPFYGDDYNDTALYDLLPILKRIAEEGNDVRIELAKYREEIVRKITSNISLKDI